MRLLLCYKNFSKDCSVSHIGLGVTASYSAKTLNAHGIPAEPKAIYGADDLSLFIEAQENGSRPVTHVILMAQFIAAHHLAKMVIQFSHIQFVQKCHSGVGFLQAEPSAISLLRSAMDLETGVSNFKVACNNHRIVHALQHMYGRPVTYLPNLYYLHGQEPIYRPRWNGGTIKIGAFGSHRIYKNFSTAIAAAIELTQEMKCNSEIWINSGRNDGAGNTVYRTAVAWTKGLPNVTLKELHWASWPEFKRFVGSMDIHLQPSYTETFNNVVADCIAEGTPSVVGPSIEWCPKSWQAEPDDSSEVAHVARRLLLDHHAARDGYRALKNYVALGLPHWKAFLQVASSRMA